MFTSRAEYRLLFNYHSAELRLLEHAKCHGLIPEKRLSRIEEKKENVATWVQRLETGRTSGGTFAEAIRRGKGEDGLPDDYQALSRGTREQIYYQVKYKGYLEREIRQIERFRHLEKIQIPEDIDYQSIRGLRNECWEKLAAIRPATLGQAGRISGVNPADLSVLMVALEARGRRESAG
jgi:tRNA uridine 5-carboxymethylaminomethyl modification enzyme